MKILDWYILKKYLGTFFFICLLFTIISVVVDFSEKVDDLAKVSLKQILSEYYLNFIPYINALLWPLFALIAVMFFTSRLANDSEFIAMIGTGVNFYRLLVPYVIGASVLCILLLIGNHFIIPSGNKVRTKFENTYVWKNNYESKFDNIHLNINPTTEIYMRTFSIADSTGRDFTLVSYNNQEMPYKLYAGAITPVKGKPKTWTLKQFRRRNFNGLHESLKEGAPTQTMDTLLGFAASDLVRRDNFREAMTTPELNRFIATEQARGSDPAMEYQVEGYRRTSDPFSIFILTLMGVSVASRKTRGGLGVQMMLGMIAAGIYVFISKFSATFAIQGGLPPMLGVWIPNIIFAIVAIVMLIKAQK